MYAYGRLFEGLALRELGHYRASAEAYQQALVTSNRHRFALLSAVAAGGAALGLALAGDLVGANAASRIASDLSGNRPSSESTLANALIFGETGPPSGSIERASDVRGAGADEMIRWALETFRDVAERRMLPDRADDARRALAVATAEAERS